MSDIRVALRLLWKDKGFTATAALTLALCIGANTALFSVVDHVLLRPLPFADAERIVLMANHYPGAGVDDIGGNSGAPDYYDRLRETTVFDAQAMYNSSDVAIDREGEPTRVRIMNVTPSFFRVLQATPRHGRTFTDDEGEIGREHEVVLSYALWQSQFGGRTGAMGSDLRIDGQPYTIVGVMPERFRFLDDNVMLWRPLAFTPERKERRHSNNWRNIARLRPGATIAQAQAQIDALNRANLDRFPQYKQLLINARFYSSVVRLQDDLVRGVRSTLYLLWGGAVFVLLIGCVNVANLVLVRSRGRVRELATRLALGAGRSRLARQLVTESLLLTLGSAAAGVGAAIAALRAFAPLGLNDLPRGAEIRVDAVVIVYTLTVAAAIGVVLGLIPVAGVLRANVTTVLREEGRSSTTGRGARTLRRGLVVAQVAFAFVLLVGAGLLFASFRRVLAVDPGFDPNGVLTASVTLPPARYKEFGPRTAFVGETVRRLRAQPGVVAAGATDSIPFGDDHSDSVILAEGYQMQPGESVISPNQVDVTPGYFEAMRATLVRGRFFDERDSTTSLKVVIVDEKLARHFWPGRDPIGRRLYRPSDINNLLTITPKTQFLTVVGVVHDIRLTDLVHGNGEVGSYFLPMTQDAPMMVTFAVRTATDPAAFASSLRTVVAGVDRELPLFDTETMEERMDRSLTTRRSPVVLSLGFGAIALFLSAIGIYGVLAYLVTQRTREIGIRIALGGSARAIFELVLREGVALLGVGLLIGGAGAFALRRTLESQLFGIRATDPRVLTAVALVLGAVALLACALPARRATRIDPVVALAE